MGSYKGSVKPLHFVRYIYLRFHLLYLMSLTLLTRYSSSPSTLTGGEGSWIYLGRASNIGVVGRRTDI